MSAPHFNEASVGEVIAIGLDLAKTWSRRGGVVFRKKFRRDQLLTFFAGQPRCLLTIAYSAAKAVSSLGA